MSITTLNANMAQLAVLRGKNRLQDLEAWVQGFGKGDPKRAERYLDVVRSYFGGAGAAAPQGEWRSYVGGKSPQTKKIYLHAITEFFEWISRLKGRVVSPEDVTRADAAEYVQFLSNPRPGMEAEKVKDGDRNFDRKILEYIEKKGEVRFHELLPVLAKWKGKTDQQIAALMDIDPANAQDYGVERRSEYRGILGRLVNQQIIKCTPSVRTLRREKFTEHGVTRYPYSRLGINLWEKDGVPFDFLFTYGTVGERVAKRSTVALKISALSSFWDALSQGENKPGGEPILKHNIWKEHVKMLSSRLRQEKKDSASKKLLTAEEIGQLFAAPVKDLAGLRDRAIIYLLAFTGIRSNELLQLKRGTPTQPEKTAGWFEGGETPKIFVTRKRGRREYIPYPHIALHHLQIFQREMAALAAKEGDQWENPQNPNYIPSEDKRWLYQALGLPSAPLFPLLGAWGRNKGVTGRVRHLSRSGLFLLLRRAAQRAGFTEQQVKRVHPHAFRHFFATTARAGGMPIHEIQARLGVTSLTTLEVYFDAPPEAQTRTAESAVLRGMGGAFGGGVEPIPEPPRREIQVPPEKVPGKRAVGAEEVIETVGEPAPLESPLEVEPAQVLPHEGFTFFRGVPEMPPNKQAEPPTVLPVQVAAGELERVDEHARKALVAEKALVSLGAPEYSYEGLRQHGTGELISFTSRKDEKTGFNLSLPPDKPKYQGNKFLLEYYDPWPLNYGVGQRSLLPWFFVGGAPDKYGFFSGAAPLPVWSRDQLCPDTETGEHFLVEIEALYLKYLTGDAEKGLSANPAQAYGLLRWFGFFVYAGHRLTKYFYLQDERPEPEEGLNTVLSWHPWASDIPLTKGEKNIREHDERWLLDWLGRNAHTYKTSLREYRNVARKESGDQWLLATLEGVSLVETSLPAWFAEDDPLALPEEEWGTFVRWLANITGKRFTMKRQESRMQTAALSASKQQAKRAQVEKALLLFFEANTEFYEAEKLRDTSAQDEAAQTMRAALASYIGITVGLEKLSKDEQKVMFAERVKMDTFVRVFQGVAERLKVPNPLSKEWREHPRVAQRAVEMVNRLYPQVNEEDVLLSGNVVADSELFSQLELDPDTRKVGVKEEYREDFIEKFGQDPELLLRRALRGMWEAAKEEAKKKGKEVQAAGKTTEVRERSYNVMLSYLSWIIPSGKEMERRAFDMPDVGKSLFRRLPKQAESGGARTTRSYEQLTDEERMFLRLEWIRKYQENIASIAQGDRYWQEEQQYWLEAEQEPEEEGRWGGRVGVLSMQRKAGGTTPNPPNRLSDIGVAVAAYDLMLVASIEGSTDASEKVRKQDLAGGRATGRTMRRNGAYQDYVYSEADTEETGRWHRSMTPNGRKVLLSESVVERVLDSVYVPTMLLPSPFRQIIATTLV